MGGDRIDFFVSHAGADRAWAEWVAWQLTDAGYSVELDVWDWAAGQNLVTAIGDALERADRVVALFSAAYFERDRYTTAEWSASLIPVPGSEMQRLVPVRRIFLPEKITPGCSLTGQALGPGNGDRAFTRPGAMAVSLGTGLAARCRAGTSKRGRSGRRAGGASAGPGPAQIPRPAAPPRRPRSPAQFRRAPW